MRLWSKLIAVFLVTAAAVNVMAGESDAAGSDLLRWRKNRIPIAFSTSLVRPGTAILPDSDIAGAVSRSLATWERAADIEFEVTWTDLGSASPHGKSGDGVSLVTISQATENVLMFGGGDSEAAARSRVFFNSRREISEADIVFNPFQQFSSDGTFGTYDFEAVLTHEIGHLLGLSHSPLPGSTMFESHGRNGTFSVAGFSPRTLSDADRASIRSLYGDAGDAECCGTVEGRLTAGSKAVPVSIIWAEDEKGRVSAATETDADGAYRLSGLRTGNYRLFFQDIHRAFGGGEIGSAVIQRSTNVLRNRRVTLVESDLDETITGFNGQLSDLPIIVNAGRKYRILFGGRVDDNRIASVTTSSTSLKSSKVSDSMIDFGDGFSVLAADVMMSPTVPPGEYTLTLRSSKGVSVFFPGRLTVESFLNPWISFDGLK